MNEIYYNYKCNDYLYKNIFIYNFINKFFISLRIKEN